MYNMNYQQGHNITTRTVLEVLDHILFYLKMTTNFGIC